jgi:hypothetical protein
VASAALRPLQHALRFQRLNHRGHLLSLIPYYHDGFSLFERGAGGSNVFDQWPPTSPMQNLRQAGFQSRALSRGENDNGKIIGRHKSIILREQNQFRNASIPRIF